jgi:RimJ/RimL family protein N-acetyltransferase
MGRVRVWTVAAVEKETGRWVGRIGLNLLTDWPGPDKWEVGYELAADGSTF